MSASRVAAHAQMQKTHVKMVNVQYCGTDKQDETANKERGAVAANAGELFRRPYQSRVTCNRGRSCLDVLAEMVAAPPKLEDIGAACDFGEQGAVGISLRICLNSDF
eukprot:1003977-Rhodomonas_salina.1